MKLSQLLLTLLLVAGGIVFYDVVVRPGPVEEIPVDLPALHPPAGEERAPEILAPITLEGRGDDLRLEELERRLAALEQSFADGVPAEALVPDDPEEGAEGAADGSAGGEGREERARDPDALNPPPAPLEELQSFRQKLQWVERQRQLEKSARAISQWLDAQGVTLTQEQRWAVVREALRYRAKANRIRKMPGDDEASQADKRAVVAELSSQFKDRLYDLVPAAEAQRIVDGMDQAAADAARRADESR